MTTWFDGKSVRRRRLGLGLSQVDLARAAHLSTPHLSGIETGHRQPSPAAAKRIAAGLGVPLTDLVIDEETA